MVICIPELRSRFPLASEYISKSNSPIAVPELYHLPSRHNPIHKVQQIALSYILLHPASILLVQLLGTGELGFFLLVRLHSQDRRNGQAMFLPIQQDYASKQEILLQLSLIHSFFRESHQTDPLVIPAHKHLPCSHSYLKSHIPSPLEEYLPRLLCYHSR